jgi:trigger factor
MPVNVETLGALERRLSMSVPVQDVDRQVDDRLKKLARNVKMPGFRPGKVPLKMVVQQYGRRCARKCSARRCRRPSARR